MGWVADYDLSHTIQSVKRIFLSNWHLIKMTRCIFGSDEYTRYLLFVRIVWFEFVLDVGDLPHNSFVWFFSTSLFSFDLEISTAFSDIQTRTPTHIWHERKISIFRKKVDLSVKAPPEDSPNKCWKDGHENHSNGMVLTFTFWRWWAMMV